jgi:hypothetical protein
MQVGKPSVDIIIDTDGSVTITPKNAGNKCLAMTKDLEKCYGATVGERSMNQEFYVEQPKLQNKTDLSGE